MLPSLFFTLDAMPLGPNGKIDRHALPAPERRHRESSRRFVGPRTPLEQQLAAIWADVLGTERIGVDDNFFDLGGHSLAATQVISRMRKTLDLDLPLRSFFEAPTLAAIAAAAAQISARRETRLVPQKRSE